MEPLPVQEYLGANVTTPSPRNFSKPFIAASPPVTPPYELAQYAQSLYLPFPWTVAERESPPLRRKTSRLDLHPKASDGHGQEEGQQPGACAAEGARSNAATTLARLDPPHPLITNQPLAAPSPQQILTPISPSLSSSVSTLQSTPTHSPTAPQGDHLERLRPTRGVSTKRKFPVLRQPKRLPRREEKEWCVYAAIVDRGGGEGEQRVRVSESEDSDQDAGESVVGLGVGLKGPRAVRFAGIATNSSSTIEPNSSRDDRDPTAGSTYTPSKLRFPPPPDHSWAGTFGHLGEPTPPTSHTTLHYRGASFDLVNPHASLVLGKPDFETPAEIDGLLDDYFTDRDDMPYDKFSGEPDPNYWQERSPESSRSAKRFTSMQTAHHGILNGPFTQENSAVTLDSERRAADAPTHGHRASINASTHQRESGRSDPFDLCLSDDSREPSNAFLGVHAVLEDYDHDLARAHLMERMKAMRTEETGESAEPAASETHTGRDNIIEAIYDAYDAYDYLGRPRSKPKAIPSWYLPDSPSSRSGGSRHAQDEVDAVAFATDRMTAGGERTFDPGSIAAHPGAMMAHKSGKAPEDTIQWSPKKRHDQLPRAQRGEAGAQPEYTEVTTSEQTYGETGELLGLAHSGNSGHGEIPTSDQTYGVTSDLLDLAQQNNCPPQGESYIPPYVTDEHPPNAPYQIPLEHQAPVYTQHDGVATPFTDVRREPLTNPYPSDPVIPDTSATVAGPAYPRGDWYYDPAGRAHGFPTGQPGNATGRQGPYRQVYFGPVLGDPVTDSFSQRHYGRPIREVLARAAHVREQGNNVVYDDDQDEFRNLPPAAPSQIPNMLFPPERYGDNGLYFPQIGDRDSLKVHDGSNESSPATSSGKQAIVEPGQDFAGVPGHADIIVDIPAGQASHRLDEVNGIPTAWSNADLPNRHRASLRIQHTPVHSVGASIVRNSSIHSNDEGDWETQASESRLNLHEDPDYHFDRRRESQISYANTSDTGTIREMPRPSQGQPSLQTIPGSPNVPTTARWGNKAHRMMMDTPQRQFDLDQERRVNYIKLMAEEIFISKGMMKLNSGPMMEEQKDRLQKLECELKELRQTSNIEFKRAIQMLAEEQGQRPLPRNGRRYDSEGAFNNILRKLSLGDISLRTNDAHSLLSRASERSLVPNACPPPTSNGLHFSPTHGTFQTIRADSDDIPPMPTIPSGAHTTPSRRLGPFDDMEMQPLRGKGKSKAAMSGQRSLLPLCLGGSSSPGNNDGTTMTSVPDGGLTDAELVKRSVHWTMDPRRQGAEVGMREYVPTARLADPRVLESAGDVAVQKALSRKWLGRCIWCPISAVVFGLGWLDGRARVESRGRVAEMRAVDKAAALKVAAPLGALAWTIAVVVVVIFVLLSRA